LTGNGKQKVSREASSISPNRLKKRSGFDAIQIREIDIEHHRLSAQHENPRFDGGCYFLLWIHEQSVDS
jgi:hypothetical protein